jgi:cation:H+ antiporter
VDILDVGRILAGLLLLVVGGELLVRGAANLATRVGISPLVVGLTVVSIATSAPELAVTTGAVLTGETDLAVGNVVGSNIANVLLILGLSALVLPLAVRRQLVRLDVPFLGVLSIGLLLLSLDGTISTLDGLLLLTAWVAHSVIAVWVSRRDKGEGRVDGEEEERHRPRMSLLTMVVLVLVGVGLLVAGAQLLVSGAVAIATGLGVSGLVVGLTIVAVGTSLPELVASVVAVRRGEGDIAVGNAVGSCLANIGLVLGLPSLLAPGGLPVPSAALAVDIPLMIATALALLPVIFTGFVIARWEGGLFVLLYASYTTYLVLNATEHDAEQGFSAVMLLFVLPLVGLTLVLLAVYEAGVLRGRREASALPRE